MRKTDYKTYISKFHSLLTIEFLKCRKKKYENFINDFSLHISISYTTKEREFLKVIFTYCQLHSRYVESRSMQAQHMISIHVFGLYFYADEESS